MRPLVAMRHVRFGDLDELAAAIGVISRRAAPGTARPVDFLDGVVFSATEAYLTLGTLGRRARRRSATTPAREVFYRSIRDRGRDALTIHDYLWRWDTDWFWCSKTFGAQNPRLRRVWPARYRRSDVYHRIVGWENRYGVVARIDGGAAGRPGSGSSRTSSCRSRRPRSSCGGTWTHVPMTPVWICPLRLRDSGGPLGELAPATGPGRSTRCGPARRT